MDNPRGLADFQVRDILYADRCPVCETGNLDTGWECNSCNVDCKPLVDRLSPLAPSPTAHYPHPGYRDHIM